MRALTKASISSYQKVLSGIMEIPLLEMFLEIGVELVELYPEEQYIHFLMESMQDTRRLDTIEDLNMKLRQVQNFYNDTIVTYDDDKMFDADADMDSPLAIEDVMMTLMSFQSTEENHTILHSALFEAVDTVADEYGFLDALYEMDDEELRGFVEQEVFSGAGTFYDNFISLLDMRNDLEQKEEHDDQALYVTAVLLTVNLSMFNKIRKERFKLEQKQTRKKIKRNDPCPCGSGKKYKKCCLNKTKF